MATEELYVLCAIHSSLIRRANRKHKITDAKCDYVKRFLLVQLLFQDHNDRAIAIGATLAHEMGHNLGMDHDDSSACACSGDSCIMAAALR